jgi:acetyltransferase-like isoleucine patch superfamily enzyme
MAKRDGMKIRSALLISIFKTLYLSIRFRGQIIVSRRTRILLERGARIELAPGSRLYLGRNVHIGKPLRLLMNRNSRLTIRGEVGLYSGTRIAVAENAHLEIGDQSYINYDASLTCLDHISIGKDCAISWNTNIIDGNFHELIVAGKPKPRTRPLQIGDHVWIGTGVVIVGASVGDGTVVGAGSVVTSDMPSKVLVTGNPARVVREDVTWET